MVDENMTEELKEEMRKLKEELREVKEKLQDNAEETRRKRHGYYIDIGERVGDYVGDIMDGVAEGIQGELEKSIFIGPRGRHIRIRAPHPPGAQIHGGESLHEEEKPVDFDKTAKVISALGEEHRLRILDELMSGGKYVNELQEKLSDIAASTLSSHLNILEEAGLVVQERVRGRYLVTIPGRSAYKMARRVGSFLERREQE
jgi:DNA-binding transcriptional ArsR family regulator